MISDPRARSVPNNSLTPLLSVLNYIFVNVSFLFRLKSRYLIMIKAGLCRKTPFLFSKFYPNLRG